MIDFIGLTKEQSIELAKKNNIEIELVDYIDKKSENNSDFLCIRAQNKGDKVVLVFSNFKL